MSALAPAVGLPGPTVADSLTARPGRPQLTAPYNHAWVTHGVPASQGGAVVDTHGRVLRHDGTPVPGLRAGGGTAVGLAGPDSGGYRSGNGLLSAFGMGWNVGNGPTDPTTTRCCEAALLVPQARARANGTKFGTTAHASPRAPARSSP